MDVSSVVTMDKDDAVEQLRAYRALGADRTEIDYAMEAALLALSKGKSVVDARAMIQAGGLDANGRPALALARADWRVCGLRQTHGSIEFLPGAYPHSNARTYNLGRIFPESDLYEWSGRWQAQVADVPPAHRPRKWRLREYLILFEVDEWAEAPRPPGDPLLLLPVNGWLCSVEHQWDLTDLERTVLAGHVLTP